MQRLIAVRFRNGNIVFEATGHWLVEAVNRAEYAVAGVGLVDHNAKGIHVHNVGERLALAAHFLVNAVQVFLASAAASNQAFAF